MITWDEGLLPEQRNAAMHIGSNAYLLAGPGTGKTLTLTRHICYLIDVKGVQPELICVLTFTRAAARELCQRVKTVVGHERMPKIFTLHSFALRQILRNSGRLTLVPQPLRIADDWEERNIILEDLKTLLGLGNINEARDLLNKLSADWQHLTVEKGEWEQRFANPAFLGAWREHREIYGYVLRAELVYQLKLALEQYDDFVLEGPPRYLLVDEYQDLNRCDLAVVKAIADTGAEIFAAGDDDQSIYGFRMAHPEGIRRFSRDYADACKLELEICKRCDQEILELGLFVACQDYARLRKPLRAEDGRQGAEIALLRFQNQFQEAQGIALLCRYLIYTHRVKPEQILILLRADRNGCFSSVIRQQLEQHVVPCNVATADTDPLNERTMRIVLSFLRLLENASDHLAWRTLLNQRDNRIGPGAINSVYQFARTQGLSFTEALINISNDPSLISERYGRLINAEVKAIKEILLELLTLLPSEEEDTSLIESLSRIINHLVNSPDERRIIQDHINKIIEMAEPNSIGDLLRAIQVSKEDIEQEIDEGKVNILTMHKAKGLTAEAVIIAAAEDEILTWSCCR